MSATNQAEKEHLVKERKQSAGKRRNVLTKSSKPRRVPTISLSPFMMIHSFEPMHSSMSSAIRLNSDPIGNKKWIHWPQLYLCPGNAPRGSNCERAGGAATVVLLILLNVSGSRGKEKIEKKE
jgi:hypothetical protein